MILCGGAEDSSCSVVWWYDSRKKWFIMTLNNQLLLWCIQEQLGQILLMLPLSLIVFELY